MTVQRDPLAALSQEIAEWADAGPWSPVPSLTSILTDRVLPLVVAAREVACELNNNDATYSLSLTLLDALRALTGEAVKP